MEGREGRQEPNPHRRAPGLLSRYESVLPHPKARLLDPFTFFTEAVGHIL